MIFNELLFTTAQQLAQKQEEDRAREKTRLEKKAEKEKRKGEAQKNNQQATKTKPNTKKPDMDNPKEAQRKQKSVPPQPEKPSTSLIYRFKRMLPNSLY